MAARMRKILSIDEANEMNTELSNEKNLETAAGSQGSEALSTRLSSPLLAKIPEKTQGSLLRMFADPHLLEKADRAELVQALRECVRAHPDVSELRVLFGMALCVDFNVPDAIEELKESVRLAPDSFIAQLKMGELWMRLRVMEKAEEHTHQAALLARNMMQTELARRQAATIRGLLQNGVKRDGPAYKGPWHLVTLVRKLWKRGSAETESLAMLESQ